MTEVISIIVALTIAAIWYESFKPEEDYRSTNQQYDLKDEED